MNKFITNTPVEIFDCTLTSWLKGCGNNIKIPNKMEDD